MTVLESLVRRELRTAVMTPAVALLGGITAVAVLGLTVVGGGYRAGYVAVIVQLLVPLQLLVPVLAFALGYSAVWGDKRRGGLDVLRTYPVRPWQYITATFLARGSALVVLLSAPLSVVLMLTAVGGQPPLPMYASHTMGDSPILFVRMALVTILFALVLLAVGIAMSSLVGTSEGALIGGAVVVLVLAFGLDLAIMQGLSSGLLDALPTALAVSPLSAYRGLVLQTAVLSTTGTGPEAAALFPSLLSLLVWAGGSLLVATRALT
jgi:ABC-2 type transport system permease protein